MWPSFVKATIATNIARKNALYGNMQPSITNVIFTHGQLDAWRMMGVQHDLSRNAQTVIIPGML